MFRRLLRHAFRRLGDDTAVTTRPWWQVPGDHAIALLRGFAGLMSWVVALLLLNVWASTVLRQFAPTRAWGERAGDWLLTQLLDLTRAAAGAGMSTVGRSPGSEISPPARSTSSPAASAAPNGRARSDRPRSLYADTARDAAPE